ncbi:hypothetical protein FGO68_gene16760 [Halteria grandinella]|uniref:RCC1-like domain-containing protein n=1 Tax=Halteria grandinella TaxID=5974 RepID=A0A8J8NIG8_HALGN|nr:hypothetical protein FGO68_gene16760 [Halteria grandinella]
MNSLFATLLKRNFSTSSANKTSVYLWTSMPTISPKGAAQISQQLQIPKGVPNRVAAFDNLDIQKLYVGLRASAAVSGDGKLYLFGSGNYGVLGQGTEKDAKFNKPVLVDYFVKRDKRVVDIAVGEYHSIALTDDGSVYTWGYGGKTGFFNWMYTQEVGALGHGDKKHHFTPKKVDFFEKNNIKVKSVQAGMYHCVALAEDGRLYLWGRGLYGVLGNGSNSYSLEPELNEELDILRKEEGEGKTIVKVDSADEYTGVLMKDGSYWVWGKNDRGQLGLGSGIGIDMVESESQPAQVVVEGGKVKNFATGMNTMLIQDEGDNVYKTGLKIDYTPKRFELDPGFAGSAIKGMQCGRKHYVLWNEDNKLLVWGNILKEKPENKTDGFGLHSGESLFEGGTIRDISMKYGIFGALIEHPETPSTPGL